MHCRARCFSLAVISGLSMAQMIAACGQKGPLYLPEPEPVQQTKSNTGSNPVPQVATDDESASEAKSGAASKAGQAGQE